MSNNQPGTTSIWPAMTIVLAVITLGVAGWDALLQTKNRALQDEVSKLRKRVEALEGDAKALEARVATVAPPAGASSAAARRRRAAAAAAATQPATAPATAPAPPLNPGK